MQERIPVNSESLQEHFPAIYRSFYSRCSLVISAPRSVGWAGSYAAREGGLAIGQSLPIRLYVGLAPRNDRTLRFATEMMYDPCTQQFNNVLDIEQRVRQRVEKNIIPFIEREIGRPVTSGYDAHVLTELPLDRNLGGVGTLHTSLLLGALLLERFITPEVIRAWNEQPLRDLIRDSSSRFDEMFRLLYRWERLIYGKASGATMAYALASPADPLFFSAALPSLAPDVLSRSTEHRARMEDVDAVNAGYRYWMARGADAFGAMHGWPLPLDFGLISIRGARTAHETELSERDLCAALADDADAMVVLDEALFGAVGADETVPRYRNLCALEHRGKLWQRFCDHLQMVNVRLCVAWCNVLRDGYAAKRVQALLDLMNQAHAAMCGLGFVMPQIEKARRVLCAFGDANLGKESIGVQLHSFSGGNNIIVAARTAALHAWMPDALHMLRDDVQTKVSLDYASWIDGPADGDGVRIDQWIERKVYSAMLPRDAVRCIVYRAHGETERSVCTPEEATGRVCDVELNAISGKVFVAGEAVTSKDLPTQRATIDILRALLAAPDHALRNKDLPRDAYTSYRNEFQGKIIGPLAKIVRERCGKDLRLHVTGELMDFRIALDASGLSIVIVEPLVSP